MVYMLVITLVINFFKKVPGFKLPGPSDQNRSGGHGTPDPRGEAEGY